MKEIEDRKGFLALKNWEKWLKVRKKQNDQLSRDLGSPANCLVMNKGESWQVKREKSLLAEAAVLHDYKCRCKSSGCPIFWKTLKTLKPCEDKVLGLTFPSPLRIEHKDQKLSYIDDQEYIGQATLILEEKGLTWDMKCLSSSIDAWNNSAHVKKRREELRKEITVLESHVPVMDDLIVTGSNFGTSKPVESRPYVPAIFVEEYCDIPDEWSINEDKPVLQIGRWTINGWENSGSSFQIEFRQVDVGQTIGQEIRLVNIGPLAIQYSWRKLKPHTNSHLPLRVSRYKLPRFFFDKNTKIILPGQEKAVKFWFMSRIPGVYSETWTLLTKPNLPLITFFLTGIVCQLGLKHVEDESVLIRNYMRRCESESVGRGCVEEARSKVQTPPRSPRRFSNRYSEKDIFLHSNPTLYYHMDAIRTAKLFYKKYWDDQWNLSMEDLANMIAILPFSDLEEKERVAKEYQAILRKMQEKPLLLDFEQKDYERLKYDLCYSILAEAIGQMENIAFRLQNLFQVQPPPQRKYEPEELMFWAESSTPKKGTQDLGKGGQAVNEEWEALQKLMPTLSDPSQRYTWDRDRILVTSITSAQQKPSETVNATEPLEPDTVSEEVLFVPEKHRPNYVLVFQAETGRILGEAVSKIAATVAGFGIMVPEKCTYLDNKTRLSHPCPRWAAHRYGQRQ